MRIAHITTSTLLALTLGGCDAASVRSVFEPQCMTVGVTPAALRIRAPGAGTMRVAVEARGIAVVAGMTLASGATVEATSPVDRLGLITLIAPVQAGETANLRITSRDWKEIRGDACVSADLLPRAAVRRTRAERLFAAGGIATRAGEWQRAFDRYEAAAGEFERLRLATLVGAARHAMAELAILRLDREAEASVLAQSALDAHGPRASAAIRGTLEAIKARSAVYTRDVAIPSELAATQTLIATARRTLATSPEGAREVLRLTVLEGFLAYRADSPERAEQLFARAIENCRAAADWECHGIAAQNTAVLAEARDSFAVALATYDDAMRKLDPDIAPELTADILDNMGRLQRAAGLVSESDASHARAMQLYVQLADCDGVRRTLARVGALRSQVGSLDDAMNALSRAASLGCAQLFATLDASGDPGARTDSPSTQVCASVLDASSLTSDGRNAVLQALLALKEASLLTGDVTTAQRCMRHASRFASSSRGKVRIANALGEIQIERGDPGAARSAFDEARTIADTAELPPTYEQRGRSQLGLARASLLAGDIPATLRWALQALASGSARADVRQSIDALRLLAEALRRTDEPELAIRTLGAAVHLIESVPIDELDGELRATYLATQHAAFAELTELLATSASSDAASWIAFSVAERGRARSLRYALNQTTRPPRETQAGGSLHSRDDMLSRVSAVVDGADELRLEDYVRHLDELGAAALPRAFTAGEQRELQNALARLDAVLVQYAAGPAEMFAFIIDEAGIRTVRLGDRRAIARAATALAEHLRNREPAASRVRSSARDLARFVWWPIAASVKSKRVLIAPDDALHLIPFALLPWSETPTTRLVLDHVEIATVPSATFVAESSLSQRVPVTSRDLALFGDPVFRTAEWRQQCAGVAAEREARAGTPKSSGAWTEWMPSLPASRDEVLAIAAIAAKSPQRRAHTFLGCMASGDSLRRVARNEHAVLHIATHGRIDARRPRLSALALAPEAGAPRDASFALLDILGLELHARLVTLSACETSGGRLLAGEGVLGPAQAFLQAGAASVVASAWRVEDETTSRFMRALYVRLLTQNMSIAEALRLTQREEQNTGTSYSWAAFALYGRPDTRI